MKEKLPKEKPYYPADYDTADIMSVKALFDGKATADQQTRAMKWIVDSLCGTFDLSYRPDSDRDTAFAEGKRFVGLQLVKALHMNTEILRRQE